MINRVKKNWSSNKYSLEYLLTVWKKNWINKISMIVGILVLLGIALTVYDRLGVEEKYTQAKVISVTYVPPTTNTRSYTDSDGNHRTTTDYDPEYWLTVVELPKPNGIDEWKNGRVDSMHVKSPMYVGKEGKMVRVKYFKGRFSGKLTLMK